MHLAALQRATQRLPAHYDEALLETYRQFIAQIEPHQPLQRA